MPTFCNEHVSVLLFKANWCPHCRTFEPIYDEVTIPVADQRLAHIFKFEHTNPQHAEIISRFNVRGFPTIVLYKSLVPAPNSYIQYTGPRTVEKFREWVLKHCERPTEVDIVGFPTVIYPMS